MATNCIRTLNTTCPVCGCAGIHACMGHKTEPMSDEEKKLLDAFIASITQAKQEGILYDFRTEKQNHQCSD